MKTKLIFIFILSILCTPSYAALDIFDHPKEIERKKKVVQITDQSKLLDYPKECLLKGDYREAFNACQGLIGRPGNQKYQGDILYMAGLSAIKLNRFLEARSYFNDVILLEGGKNDLKSAAYLGIADAYFMEQSYQKAFDAYKEVLRKYPDNPATATIYYRLGEILYKNGNLDESRSYLNKVRQEFPFSFEARLSEEKSEEKKEEENQEEPYSIQVGCYNEKDNADRTCEKLVKKGFDAYIAKSESQDKPLFRVKVGRLHSAGEAAALEKKLNQAGYSTKICP